MKKLKLKIKLTLCCGTKQIEGGGGSSSNRSAGTGGRRPYAISLNKIFVLPFTLFENLYSDDAPNSNNALSSKVKYKSPCLYTQQKYIERFISIYI